MTLPHTVNSNWLPRSDVRLRGTPNLRIHVLMKAWATVSVEIVSQRCSFGQSCEVVDAGQDVTVATGVRKGSNQINVAVLNA